MYRQGLTSIQATATVYSQICTQIASYATIKSEAISTQTVIFSTVRPVGYLYQQIEGRTVLRLALKTMVAEIIDETTGQVKYQLQNEVGHRFGKPPVHVTIVNSEITATEYQELVRLSPYDSFQRKETTFIDNATKRKYVMTYTYDGNIITFNQFSNDVNETFDLPGYIKAIIYAEGDKLEQNFHVVQAKWREKQEAAIAERKAEIQARKDAEAAERKRKAAEKKKAKAAEQKAKKAAAKKAVKPKSATSTKPKPSKPATEKKKREENISDMWSNWAKGK